MPLLHVVALRFKEGITDEEIENHFKTEVNLKERMPDLVESWSWGKNESLEMRKDVNQGMAWVVTVTLKDMAALEAYLPHPQHMEVKKIQGPMVDSIFVVDTYV